MARISPDAPGPRQTLGALWRSVFWVSFPFGILAFVLPIYGKELGASAVGVGSLFTAVSLVPLVIRPFLGRALDKWGRRPFLLVGLFGYSAATVVFCLADTIRLLTIGRLIQGLGQAFLWISAYTIVADAARNEGRASDFGRVDEAVNRGTLIGTSLGFGALFFLSDLDLDWQAMWFWLFAAYTIPVLMALRTGWRGVGDTRPDEIEYAEEDQSLSGQLAALMAVVFATGGSRAMVWPMLMIFLQDRLSADVGVLAMAYLPAAVISSFLPSRMGKMTDRMGRRGPMVVGLLVGALASALVPHLASLIYLATLWAVESLGKTVSVPAERAFVADIAGANVRGTSYGLYTFAHFLGAAIGPVVGGWLYENVGHAAPFYLNAAALVVGAFLVWGVLREPRGGTVKQVTAGSDI